MVPEEDDLPDSKGSDADVLNILRSSGRAPVGPNPVTPTTIDPDLLDRQTRLEMAQILRDKMAVYSRNPLNKPWSDRLEESTRLYESGDQDFEWLKKRISEIERDSKRVLDDSSGFLVDMSGYDDAVLESMFNARIMGGVPVGDDLRGKLMPTATEEGAARYRAQRKTNPDLQKKDLVEFARQAMVDAYGIPYSQPSGRKGRSAKSEVWDESSAIAALHNIENERKQLIEDYPVLRRLASVSSGLSGGAFSQVVYEIVKKIAEANGSSPEEAQALVRFVLTTFAEENAKASFMERAATQILPNFIGQIGAARGFGSLAGAGAAGTAMQTAGQAFWLAANEEVQKGAGTLGGTDPRDTGFALARGALLTLAGEAAEGALTKMATKTFAGAPTVATGVPTEVFRAPGRIARGLVGGTAEAGSGFLVDTAMGQPYSGEDALVDFLAGLIPMFQRGRGIGARTAGRVDTGGKSAYMPKVDAGSAPERPVGPEQITGRWETNTPDGTPININVREEGDRLFLSREGSSLEIEMTPEEGRRPGDTVWRGEQDLGNGATAGVVAYRTKGMLVFQTGALDENGRPRELGPKARFRPVEGLASPSTKTSAPPPPKTAPPTTPSASGATGGGGAPTEAPKAAEEAAATAGGAEEAKVAEAATEAPAGDAPKTFSEAWDRFTDILGPDSENIRDPYSRGLIEGQSERIIDAGNTPDMLSHLVEIRRGLRERTGGTEGLEGLTGESPFGRQRVMDALDTAIGRIEDSRAEAELKRQSEEAARARGEAPPGKATPPAAKADTGIPPTAPTGAGAPPPGAPPSAEAPPPPAPTAPTAEAPTAPPAAPQAPTAPAATTAPAAPPTPKLREGASPKPASREEAKSQVGKILEDSNVAVTDPAVRARLEETASELSDRPSSSWSNESDNTKRMDDVADELVDKIRKIDEQIDALPSVYEDTPATKAERDRLRAIKSELAQAHLAAKKARNEQRAAEARRVPAETTPSPLKDEDVALLAKNGLVFKANGATFTLKGDTYVHSQAFSRLGSRWVPGEKSHSFPIPRLADVVKYIREYDALTSQAQRNSRNRARRQRTTTGPDPALAELRRVVERRPDRRRLDKPVGEYVSSGTQALLAKGRDVGIPENVVNDQIEDTALIHRAFSENKPAFVLASEPGTGKTFVLGASIREMKSSGARRIVYVTLSEQHIEQIQEDLAGYDVGDVVFITYPQLREMTPGDQDVLVFDEAHYIKNISEGATGAQSRQAAKAQEWIKSSKFTIFSSATPFENPVQAYYMDATGAFDPWGGHLNWAMAYGAYLRGETLVWQRKDGSDAEAQRAREFFMREGMFTSRPIKLPAGQVESQFVRSDAQRQHMVIAQNLDAIMADFRRREALKGQAAMWLTNKMKRILEMSKMPAAIDVAKKELAEGRFPIIFLETRSERVDDFAEMRAREDEYLAAVRYANRSGDKPPSRSQMGAPPEGVIEVLEALQARTGVSRLEIPNAVDACNAAFGRDAVAEFTGDADKPSKQLDEWRAGKRKVLVATMAKGGTGLSLHDKVGNHPTTMIVVTLPWTATGVKQVGQRNARYGLKGIARIKWLFSENVPMDRRLARLVGGRMADMGSSVYGDIPREAMILEDFNFDNAPPSSMLDATGAPAELPPSAPTPATPPPAAAAPTPPKGVGRGKAASKKAMSLSQFVRNRGGINLGTGGLGGEFDQLRMKEGGTTGLVRTDGKGMDVERMLDEAVAEGYVPAETTPGDFLDMIAGDATRGQKIYSGKDGGLEAEVDRQERARLRAEQERYEEAKQEAEKRGETFPPPTPDPDAQPNDANIESSAQSDPSDSLVDDLATPPASPVDGDDDASIAAQIDSQIADRQAQIGKLAAELGPESAADPRIINLEREIFELRLKRPYTPDLFSINDRDDSIDSLARELAKMRRMDVPVDPFDRIEFIQKMQKVSDQLARKIADRAKFEMETPKPRTDRGPVGGINKMDKAFRDFLDGKITADEFEKTYEKLRLDEEAARIVVQTRVRVTEPSRGVAQFNQRLATLLRDGKIDRDAYELTVWWTGKNSSMLEGLRLQTRPESEATKGMAGFYSIAQRIITLVGSNGPVDTVVHEILHHTERMLPEPIRAAIKAEYVRALVKRMRDVKLQLEKANKSGDENAIKSAQDMMKFYGLISDIAATGLNHPEAGKKFAEALRMVSENKLGRKHYYMLLPSEFWAVKGSEYISRRFAAKDSIWAQAAQWFREFVEKIKSMIGLRSDASVIRALDAVANGRAVTGDEFGDPSLSYKGIGGRAKRRSGPIIFAVGPTDGDPGLGAGPRKSMNPAMKRIASWFSGTRTLEAGLGTGTHGVMAVEFDQKINNWANDLWGTDFPTRSILNIDPAEVAAANPDLFHASPVCKNFSKAKIAAEIDPLDKASGEAIARVIREARPPVVTVENVPDYVDTIPYNEIVSALREQGYKFETVIVDAADYGGASTRKRMIIRAVLEGDIPPLPPKVPQGDWYSTVADLIPGAKPTTMRSRTPGEKHWELERLAVNNSLPKTSPNYIDLDKPIIVSGGSTAGDIAYARNAGRPAVVIKSTGSETMRILLPDPNGTEVVTLPDGTEKRFIAKRVTGRMMARLMGLPDSFQIPNNDSFAKKVLGNGMHTATTEAVIRPLLNRPEMKGRQIVKDDVVYSMALGASVAPGRPSDSSNFIRRWLGEASGALRGMAGGLGDRIAERNVKAVMNGQRLRQQTLPLTAEINGKITGTRAEVALQDSYQHADGQHYFRWTAMMGDFAGKGGPAITSTPYEQEIIELARRTSAANWNMQADLLATRTVGGKTVIMTKIKEGQTIPRDVTADFLEIAMSPTHPERTALVEAIRKATNYRQSKLGGDLVSSRQVETWLNNQGLIYSGDSALPAGEAHVAAEFERVFVVPDLLPSSEAGSVNGFKAMQEPVLGQRLNRLLDMTARIAGVQLEYGRGKGWEDADNIDKVLGPGATRASRAGMPTIFADELEGLRNEFLEFYQPGYDPKNESKQARDMRQLWNRTMRTVFGMPFYSPGLDPSAGTFRGKLVRNVWNPMAAITRASDLTASPIINMAELLAGSHVIESLEDRLFGLIPGYKAALNIPVSMMTLVDGVSEVLMGSPISPWAKKNIATGAVAPITGLKQRPKNIYESGYLRGVSHLTEFLQTFNRAVNRAQAHSAAIILGDGRRVADIVKEMAGKSMFTREVMAGRISRRARISMESARKFVDGDPTLSVADREAIIETALNRAVTIEMGEGLTVSEASRFAQHPYLRHVVKFWRWHDNYLRSNVRRLGVGAQGIGRGIALGATGDILGGAQAGAAGALQVAKTLAGAAFQAYLAKQLYLWAFVDDDEARKEREEMRRDMGWYMFKETTFQLMAGPLGIMLMAQMDGQLPTQATLPGRAAQKFFVQPGKAIIAEFTESRRRANAEWLRVLEEMAPGLRAMTKRLSGGTARKRIRKFKNLEGED